VIELVGLISQIAGGHLGFIGLAADQLGIL